MSIFPIGAKVSADTSAFVGAMVAATGSLTAFTGAAGLAGKSLGVLAGAAGVGMAVNAAREYQAELVKLNTLVGIQTDQVMKWDSAIKDLSEQTGRAPADLARAMFAITSGGARGQLALDLLEQAAKASAIGLGNMTDIGRTATAMLQAFGDEGLTAEKAIDILTATVREGNLEAESLAGGFSRLLGPAKILGSSVEDVGGFLATFTRLGGSTEQAATGLLNVFNLLIKPPTDARKAMVKYGTSIEKIRGIIDDDGLVAGLSHLNDVLGDNVDAIGEVIPNTRSLTGFLNTANLQSEQYAITQENINDSLGVTASGFITWSQTADAAFKKFQAGAQAAAVEVGENLLPPLTALLKILGPISKALRTSAEGWDLIFQRVEQGVLGMFWRKSGELWDLFKNGADDAAESFEILDALIAGSSVNELTDRSAGLGDELERTTARAAALRDELSTLDTDIDDDTLDPDVYLPKARSDERDRRTERAREIRAELEQLTNVQDAQFEAITRVNQALRDRVVVEEEVIETITTLTEAELEAKAARLEAINGIISALEMERLGLTEGEEAVFIKTLTDLEATDGQIAHALALYDTVAALNAQAAALDAANRESARSHAAEMRRRESLRKQVKRDKQEAEAAAQRTAENEALALLQNRMSEVSRVSNDMATSVVSALISIQDETVSTKDAFVNMVTEILSQIQRLVLQKSIIEPFVNFAVSQLAPGGPGISASDFTDSATSFSDQLGSKGISNFTPGGLSSVQAQPTTIVQQNVTIELNAIDGESAAQFIRQQSDEITNIIAEGVQQSGDLATAMRG